MARMSDDWDIVASRRVQLHQQDLNLSGGGSDVHVGVGDRAFVQAEEGQSVDVVAESDRPALTYTVTNRHQRRRSDERSLDGGIRFKAAVGIGVRQLRDLEGPSVYSDAIMTVMDSCGLTLITGSAGNDSYTLGSVFRAAHPERGGVKHSCVSHFSDCTMEVLAGHGDTLGSYLAARTTREVRTAMATLHEDIAFGFLSVFCAGQDKGTHIVPIPSELPLGEHEYTHGESGIRFVLKVTSLGEVFDHAQLGARHAALGCDETWVDVSACTAGCPPKASHKVLCAKCAIYVNPDGHEERCSVRPVAMYTRAALRSAQIGGVLHQLDCLAALHYMDVPEGQRGQMLADAVSASVRARVLRRITNVAPMSDSRAGTLLAGYYLEVRHMAMREQFPLVPMAAYPTFMAATLGPTLASVCVAGARDLAGFTTLAREVEKTV